MPKLKSKSSLKGRFRITKNGKVIATQAKKRHNMRKISSRANRVQKGTVTLVGGAATIVKKYFKLGGLNG
ncbi:bL35 family ribosomal protein [Candidatus Xenohaliotis californiensis]|uniref:large ribosomal subunit protein bL35 n=1 Tax=Candidatus Xenohaliotis californiensis TaxID=84677 RepID=UPI0030C8C023